MKLLAEITAVTSSDTQPTVTLEATGPNGQAIRLTLDSSAVAGVENGQLLLLDWVVFEQPIKGQQKPDVVAARQQADAAFLNRILT